MIPTGVPGRCGGHETVPEQVSVAAWAANARRSQDESRPGSTPINHRGIVLRIPPVSYGRIARAPYTIESTHARSDEFLSPEPETYSFAATGSKIQDHDVE